MAEQQLLDYIKKARGAGQTDDLTKSLLLKNGWTEAEINEAMSFMDQPVQQQPQVEVVSSSKIEEKSQPQAQPTQNPTQFQAKPQTTIQSKTDNIEQQKPTITTYQPNSSFLAIKITIAIAVLLIFGGIGYFVAGQYINLPWNPFAPQITSTEVVANMITNMKAVKSSQSSITADATITDSENTSIGRILFNLGYKGEVTKPQADITITVKPISAFSNEPSPEMNSEMIIIGDVAYFIINNIVSDKSIKVAGLDASAISNQWFSVNQDTIRALSEFDPNTVASLGLPQNINQETTKKLQDLVLSTNLLSFNRDLGETTLNGQSMYHYLFTISKDKIKNLLNNIAITSGTDNEKIKNNISTIADAIGDIDVDVLIGKNDFLLYGVNMNKTIDFAKIVPIINMKLALKVNISNSAFNQPVIIAAPESSKNFQDIIVPVLKIQKISSNLDQVAIIGPSIYQTNANYYALCQKGYLNGYNAVYGEQLVNISKDIIAQGGKNPACYAGTRGFCVSTELTDGTFMCIDEAGISGTTKCTSSATVCSPISL